MIFRVSFWYAVPRSADGALLPTDFSFPPPPPPPPPPAPPPPPPPPALPPPPPPFFPFLPAIATTFAVRVSLGGHNPPEDNILIDPAKHGFPREAVPPEPSGVVRMAINGGFLGEKLLIIAYNVSPLSPTSPLPHPQPPEDSTLIDPHKHGFPREAVPPVPSGVVRMAINGGFTVKDLGENRCHYRGIFTVDLKMPPALVNFVTKGFGGMLFTVFSKEIESDLADSKGSKGKAFRKVLEEEQLYVRIREAMGVHRDRKEKQQERVGGGGGAVVAAAGMGDDGEEEEEWDGGESEAFYSPASSFSSSFHAHALPHLSLDHAAASESPHPHATEGTHLHLLSPGVGRTAQQQQEQQQRRRRQKQKQEVQQDGLAGAGLASAAAGARQRRELANSQKPFLPSRPLFARPLHLLPPWPPPYPKLALKTWA
ncbi:unnamed protein product [Closterium sp. NIES-54]